MQREKKASKNDERVCKTCQKTLPQTIQFFTISTLAGKQYYSKHCKACARVKASQKTRKPRKKESMHSKRARGKIQVTIPEEKAKALQRDKACIYCGSSEQLQFHHVYYKALERIYTSERNLAHNGVILCFPCHRALTDGDQEKDQFCRDYLQSIQ